MMATGGVWALSAPWVVALLFAVGMGALEGERYWTRVRRQAGASPGPLAYCLDVLFLAGAALFLVGFALLLVRLAAEIGYLAGSGAGWAGQAASAHPWRLAAGVLVCLVVAVASVGRAAWRARSRRARPPAAQPAAEIPPVAAGVTAAPAEPVDEALGSLSIYQSRARPDPAAAGHPSSFLDMRAADTPPEAAPKRRSAVGPALVGLLVIALVGGAVVFRPQIGELLAGERTDAGLAAAATTPAVEPTASAPAAAANPAASAPEVRRVRSESLNLRAAPGTDQSILAVLARGQQVALLSESQAVAGTTWVKVRAGALEGWVSDKLLEP